MLLILFAGCASISFAQESNQQPKEIVTSRPSPEYLPDGWKEFSSNEGRFTLLFPGVPEKHTNQLESPYGKLEEHGFLVKTFAYYSVAYTDFPETDGIRDVKMFFAGFRVGNLKATNAELLEDMDDYRFAYPGRFIKTLIGRKYVNRIRLHLIRNRLYVLSVVMPEEQADAETRKFYEETAMKFLNSFKPKIDYGAISADRFGDPKSQAPPPLLPSTGINVDPAVSSNRPDSKDSKEPFAKVSGGILNGKAISLPKPVYPADAKAAGASGEVRVRIVVDESGNVIWAKMITGHELLQAVSEAAASKAKFAPLIIQDKPARVYGFLIYNFTR